MSGGLVETDVITSLVSSRLLTYKSTPPSYNTNPAVNRIEWRLAIAFSSILPAVLLTHVTCNIHGRSLGDVHPFVSGFPVI